MIGFDTMTPAAIHFSDPVMLAGLLAAGVPVALHLLNKVRSPIVPFPTLRFLRITAQKTSRKRELQHWLLLLLRMAVFALIAMAAARPLVKGASPTLAYGLIVTFLAGAGLLVLGAVFMNAAVNNRGSPVMESATGPAAGPPRRKMSPAAYGALSALALVAGLFAAGASAFGLGSDRLFPAGSSAFNGNATACVFIVDNSASMLALQDGATRASRAAQQARQLITETLRPAELALLATNPGSTPVPDRLATDPTSTVGLLDKLPTTGRAVPLRALLKQAQALLDNSNLGNKMIVLLSDFQRPALADADTFEALSDQNTQVIFMPAGKSTPPDLGITSFTLDAGQPVVGSEVTFDVQLVNNADARDIHDVELQMDGTAIPNTRAHVQLGPAGGAESKAAVKLSCRLPAAGFHRFSAALKDQSDAMKWDDTRDLALTVSDQIHVLVVGPSDRPTPRDAAFFVSAALAPFSSAPGGPASAWSLSPAYKPVAQLAPADLAGNSAVFLCDVPTLTPQLADALHNYVSRGGRLAFLLGPRVDAANYNQQLAGPRNLLPAALAAPVVSPAGSVVDSVDTQSPVFAGLFDSQDPFRAIVVTGRWALPGNAPERGQVLQKLADGSVLLTRHTVDKGDVFTLLTAPAGTWSNLATTVPFLPTLVRVALGDSGKMKHETAHDPGDPVELSLPPGHNNAAVEVTAPSGGAPASLPPTSSPRTVPGSFTQEVGTYTWKTTDTPSASGLFVVNHPGPEADLQPADPDALGKSLKTKMPVLVAYSPAELTGQLRQQNEGSTLAPGVAALVLILAILEAFLANRHQPTPREITPAEPARRPQPREPVAA